MTLKHFDVQSVMPGTVHDLMAFHAEPAALRKLMLPPTFIQVIRDERASLTSGELEFTLWIGPVPIRWVAQHLPGPTASSFTDQMLQGPMAKWEHQHLFEPAPGGTGTILHDRIRYAHKPGLTGLLTRLVFDGLPLRVLFWYRHWRTRRALS